MAHQAEVAATLDGIAASRDAETAQDVGDVGVNGAPAEEERLGNLTVGVPMGDEAEEFCLDRNSIDRWKVKRRRASEMNRVGST